MTTREIHNPHDDGSCECDTPILVYLAAPFTSDDPRVEHKRVVDTDQAAGMMTQMGAMIYSPLNHFAYPFMRRTPADRAYAHGIHMLARCDALLVLCLDGWAESEGVRRESEYADRWGMPRVLVEPNGEEELEDQLVAALNVLQREVNAEESDVRD